MEAKTSLQFIVLKLILMFFVNRKFLFFVEFTVSFVIEGNQSFQTIDFVALTKGIKKDAFQALWINLVIRLSSFKRLIYLWIDFSLNFKDQITN